MDSIFRGAATYLFVWAIFRIAGKRSLAQITTFDAVLLLIVSEATDAALLADNSSFTNSVLLILTLLGLDVLFSWLKLHFPALEKVMDSNPIVLLDGNGLRKDVLSMERVNENDILHSARHNHGMTRLDGIQYAILEQTGDISIIPKKA
jgi:uncharacterized membrane protein YcaP (DUF421 family)